MEHLGDGGLDALMSIRDRQLDAAQAAPGEFTPGSFGQAARGEISRSIRRRTVRTAKSRS